MADQDVVTAQLETAGYVDTKFERVDAPFRIGDTIDDAIGFELAFGLTGDVYREARDHTAADHDPLVADLTELLTPHMTNGGVVMASSSWVISANNPS